MIKGILSGAASALALSTLLIVSVVLIVPPPERSTRPVSPVPAAPVLRDQAETVPRVPGRPVDVPVPQPADRRIETVVEVPAASQFNRPPEDGAAITPGVEAAPRPLGVVTEGLRSAAAPLEGPRPITESAAQPTPGIISGFGAAPLAGDAPAVPGPRFETAPRTFGEVAATDEPDGTDIAAVPEAPETGASGAPEVATATARPAPDVAARGPAVAEAVPAAPDTPTDTGTGPLFGPGEIAIVDTPILPAAEVDRPAPEVAEAATAPRRLILDSAQNPETVGGEVGGDGAETSAPEIRAAPRALIDNAAPFENPQDLPLMSIVLIDDPEAGVDRDSLAAFDFPVTFAIDATRDDADAAATAYRAAGHEVVALAEILPVGATAQDIEIAIFALRRSLPQAVGLLDRTSGSLVSDRAALEAILPAMAEAGLGLLAYPGGLNTGVTAARRAGVPATTIYRVLDAEGEQAARITRYLDRATFEAVQDGTAVVIGRGAPETIAALYSWRLGTRADQVAAAPLSAVLTALTE